MLPASLVLALAGALLLALLGAGSAYADPFGELGRVGTFGIGAGDFTYPTGLAVDQEDNSVFVVDEPEGTAPGVFLTEPANFRLQKFSSALVPEGSANIPTPSSGPEEKQFVIGVAVDAKRKRVYVLKAIQTGRGKSFQETAATEIEAFSTQPSSGSLSLDPGVSTSSKLGVYFVFPTVPNSGAVPAEAVLEPHGFAVEPESGDLVILGEKREQPTVLWRISGTTTGTLETEMYLDGGAVEGGNNSISGPTSVATGPHDEELYLSGNEIGGGGQNGVIELVTKSPHTFADPEIKLIQSEGAHVSPPGLTGGKSEDVIRGNGSQLAVSSDGSIVYAAEISAEQGVNVSNEPTAGNFEIRGMSTSDGSQRIVYGGGTGSTKCRISSEYNAVAAGGNGVVYVLDEGEAYINESAELVHSSFGFELIKFGPEGEGQFCAAPALSFAVKVNHKELSPPAKVEKGDLVELVASEAELKGAIPAKLTWKATGGSVAWEEEEAHSPPSLQEGHRFLKPGVYSVELSMNVTEAPFGQPPAVTKTVEVTAPAPTALFEASTQNPKPGENVTFDAKESVDPKGLCSEATGCTTTNALETYMWKFGDGTIKETNEPTYSRSFSNPGSQARSETVELIVENKEGVQSSPLIEHLIVQGTPETGTHTTSTTTTTPPPPLLPAPGLTGKPSPSVSKPLTKAQKLAKALKACKKIKSHRKRASCERQAKAKYAPKPKKKKKK